MGFYEETLAPILHKTAYEIEKTAHMQDIVHGTMSEERFRFQIKQNYQYLLDYTRCWALALAKCRSFKEMEIFYPIVKNTMESTVMINRTYWADQLGLSVDDMDKVIEAPGKRSYTAFQLMTVNQGGLAEAMMALFPCNIIYRYFGEDLLEQCKLPKDNMFYKWLEYYTSDEYIRKTENEISIVNKLCRDKSEKEKAWLLEIMCNSCNYEILQWQDMYHNMTTWPLDDIYPEKFTSFEE
ncbi:MAG: hypothetical protein IKE93_08975 [Erysipelotrichaceae bacterium]|nr:hypothetical protein [Erysipelotrichaceae bacterium]MBR2700868.1 hypothetical protein [Erysipelotrichaceae bacterium]